MGLKDFFKGGNKGGGGGGRKGGKLARQIKTITNPYTQSQDRYANMQGLLDDGSDEAYVGLLRRFTITSTKSIEDEEEKGWVYRRLSAVGKPILPALKTFCLEADNIAWALRILEDVANEKEEWDILDALLEKHQPGYERDPAKKLQLLGHLQEIDDPRISQLMVGYLADDDETVRYFAVEALIDIAEEEVAKPALCKHLESDEDSIRLRNRICDGLAKLEWDISASKDAIASKLGTEFGLEGNKVVAR